MLTKILLAFTVVCNFATLLGLWIAYEASPATLQLKIGHVLAWSGAIASAILYFFVAWLVMHGPKMHEANEADEADDLESEDAEYKQLFIEEQKAREKYQEQLTLAKLEIERLKPNPTVKDSDPLLEIKIADLRGKTMSDEPKEQACFDLINRGTQSPARFACIEDFNIGGYRVAFRSFPPSIQPFNNHESITPLYINNPDGTLCQYNIFEVCLYAWSELKNPKLYEWPIPIKATYQDDGRNLFEVHCDLVFCPSEYANRSRGQMNNDVIKTKNHKIRKVSPALSSVDWSGPVTAFP